MLLSDQLYEIKYLRENGWRFYGTFHTGWIDKGAERTFCRMTFRNGGFEVFLHDPPKWLLKHKHYKACFTKVEEKWFFLHQNDRFDDLVLAIEGVKNFFTRCREETKGARTWTWS